MEELLARRDEVERALTYMNAEARDGLSHEDLVKSWIRYLANRALDLDAEIQACCGDCVVNTEAEPYDYDTFCRDKNCKCHQTPKN